MSTHTHTSLVPLERFLSEDRGGTIAFRASGGIPTWYFIIIIIIIIIIVINFYLFVLINNNDNNNNNNNNNNIYINWLVD